MGVGLFLKLGLMVVLIRQQFGTIFNDLDLHRRLKLHEVAKTILMFEYS